MRATKAKVTRSWEDDRNAAQLRIAFGAMMRLNEHRLLQWRQVRFGSSKTGAETVAYVDINFGLDKHGKLSPKDKGDSVRRFEAEGSWAGDVYDALRRWRSVCGQNGLATTAAHYVFPDRAGRPLTESKVTQVCHTLSKNRRLLRATHQRNTHRGGEIFRKMEY